MRAVPGQKEIQENEGEGPFMKGYICLRRYAVLAVIAQVTLLLHCGSPRHAKGLNNGPDD